MLLDSSGVKEAGRRRMDTIGNIILDVITPSGEALCMQTDCVSFPSETGEVCLHEGHRPIVATLVPGTLVAGTENPREFHVAGGLALAKSNHVTVLTMED